MATDLSETLETPPAVLSVHKFPFLEVPPNTVVDIRDNLKMSGDLVRKPVDACKDIFS